jgi:kynureninase
VHDACEVLGAEVERNPDRFHRETYRPRLDMVRARLAALLGAAPEECVVVQNASYGLNVVLRNFEWRAGDVMIGGACLGSCSLPSAHAMTSASTTYGSIVKTFQYLHDIHPETILAPFHLEFPTSHADILSSFRAHLRALPAPAPSAANPAPQRVAVIDALVSAPGALLPWEEMVAICREEGVYSVVDAAHAVGQQTGINLAKSRPDFWVSASHVHSPCVQNMRAYARAELSQVALRKARLRGALRARAVRLLPFRC